jgi:hypothetical protein
LWADADELSRDGSPEGVSSRFCHGRYSRRISCIPTIESPRKDDGSFNLKTRASLLNPFATDNIHLIGESLEHFDGFTVHSEFDGIREDKKKASEATSSSLEEGEEELPMPVPHIH